MNLKTCYHCGLIIKNNINYHIIIDNIPRYMCCLGCLAVSKFIMDNNFSDYYSYRSNFNKTVDFLSFSENEIYDDIVYQLKFIKKKKNFDYIVLAIDGITCSACTWLIENHIKKIFGVINISINLATCRAHLLLDIKLVKLSFILNEILKLGYKAYPYLYNRNEKNNLQEYKKELKKLIIAGLGMSQVMMLSASLYVGEGKDLHFLYWNFIRWINFIISTPVLFYSGLSMLLTAYRSIKAKTFGMDFTVSLSLILAYLASIFNLLNKNGDVYFDSICMFIFFLLVGRFLEMRARHYSNNIIFSLQELTSYNANIVLENGNIKNVLIDEICINDIVLLKQGDTAPVDGIILNGDSEFDESMLTGESLPIFKKNGDNILGGSTNLGHPVLIKSTKKRSESKINVIIEILENAMLFKPKINIYSDKIANFFITCVLVLTSCVSLVWFLFSDENILNIALSMLVITCPCALSLAVPIALVSSINFLTKNGFLVINSERLDVISKVTDIVFDKTGTLTVNEFMLDRIKVNGNFSLNFVFTIAYLLEEKSNHPISSAFIKSKIDVLKNLHITNTINYINNGIEGVINNEYYRIGKVSFIKEWVLNFTEIDYDGFYIVLANKYKVLAWFKINNPIRKNLYKSILDIKKLGLKIHILSGDYFLNVYHMSTKLSVKTFLSNASFNDKINYIKRIQASDSIVMMIGDGVNDAPALNTSNISVSMGSGVDLAKINSDAILLNNDLNLIPRVILHCSKLMTIIKQNIFWAIIYNLVGLMLAGLNLISPYYAALGMSLSSFLVVLNSLRLNKI